MKCLLVGGHHDGKNHDIDPRRRDYQVAIMPRVSATEAVFRATPGPTTYQRELYTRRTWRCGGGDEAEWFIYGEYNLSDADIFQRLLSHYRPPIQGE